MMISKETLDRIKETDKHSDKPLSDDAIRDLAKAAGEDPDDLLRDFHKHRGSGDPMPIIVA